MKINYARNMTRDTTALRFLIVNKIEVQVDIDQFFWDYLLLV